MTEERADRMVRALYANVDEADFTGRRKSGPRKTRKDALNVPWQRTGGGEE
jgi:hypothetical protein